MYKKISVVILWIGILFFPASASVAQNPGLALTSPLKVKPNAAEEARWSWTNDKWTGNSRPYEEARRQIDQAIAKGQNPEILIEKYRAIAEYRPLSPKDSYTPYDPLACYRWGYAAWKTINPSSPPKEQAKHLLGVSQALQDSPSPHVYEFSRLHFLVDAWFLPWDHLKNIGLRLVEHSPDDLDVKYQMTRILSQTVTPQSNRLALSYAKDLVRLRPERPSSFAALGGAYQDSWEYLGNKVAAAKSLVAYQRCLAIMPPATYWRSDLIREINRIQQRINILH